MYHQLSTMNQCNIDECLSKKTDQPAKEIKTV